MHKSVIPKIITFHEYKKQDSIMRYRADKEQCVKDYNLKNKTGFRFISELVHKLYETGVSIPIIADVIEVSRDNTYKILMRMGIDRIRTGGRLNYCNLTNENIIEIRKSNATYVSMAKKYGVSPPTISSVINKQGRWANM